MQIDVLLQTDDAVYVCRDEISQGDRSDRSSMQVKDKIRRLAVPPDMTVRKVLIYSGQRVRALQESLYFRTFRSAWTICSRSREPIARPHERTCLFLLSAPG